MRHSSVFHPGLHVGVWLLAHPNFIPGTHTGQVHTCLTPPESKMPQSRSGIAGPCLGISVTFEGPGYFFPSVQGPGHTFNR